MPMTPMKETVQTQGKHLASQMLRVSADFASMVRKLAKEQGTSVTEVTRIIYLDMSPELETGKAKPRKKAKKK